MILTCTSDYGVMTLSAASDTRIQLRAVSVLRQYRQKQSATDSSDHTAHSVTHHTPTDHDQHHAASVRCLITSLISSINIEILVVVRSVGRCVHTHTHTHTYL